MGGSKILRRQCTYLRSVEYLRVVKNREHILKIAVSNVLRTRNKTASYMATWSPSHNSLSMELTPVDGVTCEDGSKRDMSRHTTPLGLFLAQIMRNKSQVLLPIYVIKFQI